MTRIARILRGSDGVVFLAPAGRYVYRNAVKKIEPQRSDQWMLTNGLSTLSTKYLHTQVLFDFRMLVMLCYIIISRELPTDRYVGSVDGTGHDRLVSWLNI